MQPQSLPEFAASIIRTLEALDIVYAVSGSFASSLYGEARMTQDIDIAMRMPLEQSGRLVDAIRALGYYISHEGIVDALVHGQPFNIIDGISSYKADLYLTTGAPLDESALARRRRIQYDARTGASAMMLSAEDVILYKLRFLRMGESEKHVRDISGIVSTVGDELDQSYIDRWAQTLGVADLWGKIRAS
ncbi:MAG: hypothetical protein HZB53_09630 [Chloroflexi bacterium]|nr:hypothetical protein [Chloroflexota bacterium]